jgi:tetratricopeptide (TPR) repeat protein
VDRHVVVIAFQRMNKQAAARLSSLLLGVTLLAPGIAVAQPRGAADLMRGAKGKPAASSPADGLVAEGSKALEAGDPKRALELFKQATEKAPKDPRPHYLSGAAHQALGDGKAAERAFRGALALDPQLAEVRAELGALLVEQRRFADAVVELKRATQERPELSEAWYNLGQAQLAQKSCPDALAAFKRVTELDANGVDGWINRSVAERRCKALEAAQASASQAVKIAPKSAEARLNLGLVYSDLGKYDDAAAALTVATQLKPESAMAWWSLGLAEQKRKRLDAAIAALGKAREISPTPPRISDLGVAYRDKGDLAKAESLFREALAKEPRYTPARWHLAQTLAAAHRCDDAKREVGQLPADDQASEAAKKLIAGCAAKKK